MAKTVWIRTGLAAGIASRSRETIRHWCEQGRITCRRSGAHWQVDQEKFKLFLTKGTEATEATDADS